MLQGFGLILVLSCDSIGRAPHPLGFVRSMGPRERDTDALDRSTFPSKTRVAAVLGGDMLPIVIPTRNRPISLGHVLSYLGKHYTGARVVVADGSAPGYAPSYDAVVAEAAKSLTLTYYRYDPEIPLGDRLIDTLESLDDDIIVVGADDDYPVLDACRRGAEFLAANEDYVVAIGGIVLVKVSEAGAFSARYLQARTIRQPDPVRRLLSFLRWPYATSYGAVRRRHFIARCANADRNGMAGFGDHTVAFHDCLAGKIMALPEIGYFTTKLPTHTRLARPERLFYLENASEILDLRNYYEACLLDAVEIDAQEARTVADRVVAMRIAQHSGGAPHGQTGFGSSKLFLAKEVQEQYTAFHELFTEGTKTRKRLAPQLRSVVDAMRQVMASSVDNAGEPTSYATLTEMLAAGETPEAAGLSSRKAMRSTAP